MSLALLPFTRLERSKAVNSASIKLIRRTRCPTFTKAALTVPIEVGDVIRYGSKGNDELGISPHTYGTVMDVDARRNLITVFGSDDAPHSYDPASEWQMRLQATVYSAEARDFAEGERIQFTRSEWDQGIRFEYLDTIERIHEDGGLSVRADL